MDDDDDAAAGASGDDEDADNACWRPRWPFL